MKLYKYVSMDAALQIARSNTIGFSRPEFFNDPFDLPLVSLEPTSNPIEKAFARVRAEGKSFIWRQNTAILSLTRTPTNPLMWAHYADAHRGVAIGIDTSVAGLCEVTSNMIPAHYGSVIYTRRRPGGPFQSAFREPVIVGEMFHFVESHYEKWQRLFLVKPIDWAYEEEVRVVKCIRGVSGNECQSKSGTFSVIKTSGRELHAFHLPQDAIVEMYVGIRSDESKVSQLRQFCPGMEVYRGRADSERYGLTWSHTDQ